jgi:ABC-type nitrate/sulfonate/bicarbonate transport system permease component
MRRTAMIGFLIGVALGCLFGAMMQVSPSAAESKQPFGLSVNQQTGKPQIHVKGKPEIK